MCDTETTVFGELDVEHTRMTPREAVSLARDLWKIDVDDAVRLDSEKDDTFRLEPRNGKHRYILKVAHPAEDASELEFEGAVADHIANSGCDVPVPQLVPPPGGPVLRSIRDEAGQSRLGRVLTFLDGVPLHCTSVTAQERERVGEALAKLRLALADYSHTTERRYCVWDITHLPALRSLIETIDQPPERLLLLRRAFARYMEQAAPHVPRLRRQILHNDFNKMNVLVDHDKPAFVTGVIDFGDAVRTAIAIDVSTALHNYLADDIAERPGADLFADCRDVLRGYRRRADLTEEELGLLPHLVMGRVIARMTISLNRAAKMPENRGYLLRDTEPGWARLEWFLDRDADALAEDLSEVT